MGDLGHSRLESGHPQLLSVTINMFTPCERRGYRIEWNEEGKYIFVKFFAEFDKDSAEHFRKDALDVGKAVKAQHEKVRVLHDLTEIGEAYKMTHDMRALLVDAMEYVDRMASFRPGSRIRRISLQLFDIVGYLSHGKEVRFFETEGEAKAWLLK